MLLNSPHNPTGKVFSRSELEVIARICIENDVIAVTDEVYEHLVFDDRRTHTAGYVARHGRANHHDFVCRKNLLVHRLEDRLGVWPSGVDQRGAHSQTVPDVCERRPVATGGRGRASAR